MMSRLAMSWTQTPAVMQIEGTEIHSFRIVGITPLLCNNPASMLVGSDRRPGERIPRPEEEAERKAYRSEDGLFVFPADALRHAVVRVSSIYKVGRTSLRSYMAHIMVSPPLIPILDPDAGKPVERYEIDLRRAVVQKQGVLRSRPRFDRWMLDFNVHIDPSLIDLSRSKVRSLDDFLAMLLADAGQRVGIGDYRPDKGGPFGRFRVLR